ncbi:MAG: c-type cytochrome, partial [Gemmatimonadota bacterium]|nr:c-type cytochrome [Gemmatimonadota bacterium]
MTNFAKTAASALTAALPFLLSSGSLSAQDADPLSFTPEVNTAGQAAYERSCSACHLATFQGSFEAPALAGPNFSLVWTERTLNEFRATIRTMPPMAPNSLRDAEYDAITVYLLGANGAERDGRVVRADREATVGSLLAGTATAGAATASAGRGAGAGRGGGAGGRGGRGGAPRTEPEGVTETFHEIIDFEPVTEQELLNPDPGDWLIYRRTYDSQGYSPLDQIDRSNVDDLGLE